MSATPHGHPLPDDVRLTRFGQLLRSTSLDELPELWNVVKGDMSLVGPRPLLMKYLPLYTSEQARRHDVRPGVTGWAQVNGRNSADWHEKLAMDTWYVDNVSFVFDLKILVRTVTAVFARHGISADGHATAPEFTGLGRRLGSPNPGAEPSRGLLPPFPPGGTFLFTTAPAPTRRLRPNRDAWVKSSSRVDSREVPDSDGAGKAHRR